MEGIAAPGAAVQPYLASVANLYEDLEYDRALEQVITAKRLSSGVEDDVALALWEGILQAELNREEAAATAFKAALFLKPDARLPVLVSPKLRQRFESLRGEVKRTLARRGGAPRPVPAPAPVADAPRQEPARPLVAEPPPPADTPRARAEVPAPLAPEARTERSMRSRAHLPAIIGGALAAAGGVSWALSRSELSKLRNADPSLSTPDSVDRSVSRGRTLQTAGVGLVGAGVLGLGVAAGMYLLGAPTERVTVRVGTDGGSALVSGEWP